MVAEHIWPVSGGDDEDQGERLEEQQIDCRHVQVEDDRFDQDQSATLPRMNDWRESVVDLLEVQAAQNVNTVCDLFASTLQTALTRSAHVSETERPHMIVRGSKD